MTFQHFAGAAYRALTARKDGPSLYDVCDPVLLNPGRGDPHISKFYRTALGNPALRSLLRRTGLAELRDEARLERLREALVAIEQRAGVRHSKWHNSKPSRRVRFGMYLAYTLKSISGLVCPSIAATQDGASPAARAFEAKVCRVWYMVRRRRPAAVRIGYQVRSRRAFTFSRPPAGPVNT